jgi:DNA primase
MGKVSQKSANYRIVAEVKVNGIIEKSDVVGAIFGQTEGLLGEDLDLRELRNRGKVGRMEVDLENDSSPTEGSIEIATSMDATDTSILAASLETIEKIGPAKADIRIEDVLDVRSSKRDYILKRSKQILEDIREEEPGREKLREEVEQEVRESEISEFRGFPAGPEVRFSDSLVLVEGEADVKNLLRKGVKNALALGGTSVPERVTEISEDRTVTAFLDGDRGGDLILEELENSLDLDYVVRAPEGMEVEELPERKVHELLRDREDERYAEEPEESADDIPEGKKDRFLEELNDLIGTRAISVLKDGETVERKPKNSSLDSDTGDAVVADGEVDERIVNEAEKMDAEFVLGRSRSPTVNSGELRILTEPELGS